MPMYEFACRECGGSFEKRLRMAESSDVQACPSCGSMDTRKRIGAAVSLSGVTPKSFSAPPPRSPFT